MYPNGFGGKSPQLTLFFVQIWHHCLQMLERNLMRTRQCKHASNSFGFFLSSLFPSVPLVGSSPVLFRFSLSTGKRTSERGLKYYICISFPPQRVDLLSFLPSSTRWEPRAGFLTSVRATFLCRRETTPGKPSTGTLGFSSWRNKGVAALSLQAKELWKALKHIILSHLINRGVWSVSSC